MTTPTETLIADLKRASLLNSISGLLDWDQQVNLPEGSALWRAQQLEALSTISHKAATLPRIGKSLDALDAKGEAVSPEEKVLRRCARKDYERLTKLPAKFVSKKALLDSQSFQTWIKSKECGDFSKFAPFLKKEIIMTKKRADYLEASDVYDDLIDTYAPGLTVKRIEELFGELKKELIPLADKILSSGSKTRKFIIPEVPAERQLEFLKEVTATLGLDYSRSRIDTSEHPFSTGNYFDNRITTHFKKNDVFSALFSSIHETGHALYEQGLPPEWVGTPLGEAMGMAIHESQSRLWENQVARSRAFWKYWEGILRKNFSPSLDGISSEELYLTINAVARNPIRCDSDEVTYNLHIILRFEIEKKLFDGTLKVKGIPTEWNRLSQELLGYTPKNNSEGCLQDVHWSTGSFGYFPSYCVGNMIAAQL
jgi:carboxypeptidase Taq